MNLEVGEILRRCVHQRNDQLDKVVKPNLWSKAVSPLIRLAQTHDYTRIFPKLFVRSDLFIQISNLTNKESLRAQAVQLIWKKEELFALFFKVVFACALEKFVKFGQAAESLSDIKRKEILQKYNKPNSYKQLPPDEYLIRPLVEVFFGKAAIFEGRSSDMYDWLYANLQNADNTISLRPFLDLIKYAMEKQLEKPDQYYFEDSILSPRCFNAEVREMAAKGHFEDLAEEEGNENLRTIIYAIRNDEVPKSLKYSPIYQSEFEKLLQCIVDKHPELKDVGFHDLEGTLTLNGIMSVGHAVGGEKKYTFAYLYKYFLGLGSPNSARKIPELNKSKK